MEFEMQAPNEKKVLVRLPSDVAEWLIHQTERILSSQNSEVVRAIREKVDGERLHRSREQTA